VSRCHSEQLYIYEAKDNKDNKYEYKYEVYNICKAIVHVRRVWVL
jgi:hypothetical protein